MSVSICHTFHPEHSRIADWHFDHILTRNKNSFKKSTYQPGYPRLFVLSLSATNTKQMKKYIVFLLILIPYYMDLLRWNRPPNHGLPESREPYAPTSNSVLMLLEQIENKENYPEKIGRIIICC